MNIWRFLEQAFAWHFPPDDYVRWGWWMLGMPLLVVIALRAPFYVAREWEGSKQRAIRSGILFVAVILASDVAYYAQAARLRATVSPQECNVKGPSPYGPYDAQVCVTASADQDTGIEGFVRLRSTKDGSVLAEKEFYNPSFNEVFWAPDELIVGVGDGMAIVQIPPSRMDLLRAKLP